MTLRFSILKADTNKLIFLTVSTFKLTINVSVRSKILDKRIVSMMGEIDGGTSDIRQGGATGWF